MAAPELAPALIQHVGEIQSKPIRIVAEMQISLRESSPRTVYRDSYAMAFVPCLARCFYLLVA
jgi:hypothetical protein